MLLTILYGRWEGKKQKDQERKGLLLLLDAEIHDNNEKLDDSYGGDVFRESGVLALRTESWDGSKVRLAQLLPAQHVYALTKYYEHLRWVQEETTPCIARLQEDGPFLAMRLAVQSVKTVGDAARVLNRGYIGENEYTPYPLKIRGKKV